MNLLTIFAIVLSVASNPHKSREAVPDNKGASTINAYRAAATSSNNESVWIADISERPYDSLCMRFHEQNSAIGFESFFRDFILLDSAVAVTSNIPDSVYEARLKMILSPIQMPYNEIVKRYIVAYTTTNKKTMEYILGRSQNYFSMIEYELDRQGIPLELRMLPAIESALSPVAVSRAGATGMWQFMHGTGRTYGLEINTFIDQRRDPVLSTKAACRYLKDLYNIYGDWTLALAAYNCGPGNVNKAIKRSGGNPKDFWDIYEFLPKETRGYVPSFIAATYAYNFHSQHNLRPATYDLPLATDTLMISKLMHFEQICSTIDTPIELVRSLNPQYKLDIIPAVNGKSYSLTLPMREVSDFLEKEEEIMQKDSIYLSEYLRPSGIDKAKKEFSIDSYTYKVKSGDTLGAIASKNGVTVAQLMKWNNIKSANKLRIGQNIEIYR